MSGQPALSREDRSLLASLRAEANQALWITIRAKRGICEMMGIAANDELLEHQVNEYVGARITLNQFVAAVRRAQAIRAARPVSVSPSENRNDA